MMLLQQQPECIVNHPCVAYVFTNVVLSNKDGSPVRNGPDNFIDFSLSLGIQSHNSLWGCRPSPLLSDFCNNQNTERSDHDALNAASLYVQSLQDLDRPFHFVSLLFYYSPMIIFI